METAPTLLPGFRVGHWTDEAARTGCTVVLPPAGNVTSCDIRGSSPSSRELPLLDPDRKLTETHGLLLTGGSAFGLAAAEGIVDWLEERGVGYQTGLGVVPIVPAAVIFDLAAGRADVRPGPPQGLAACAAATESDIPIGRVGAGAGATVGKWAGREHSVPGGLGIASARERGLVVAALAVVNAVGDVLARDGTVVAGTRANDPRPFPALPEEGPVASNTVLAVVATNAEIGKRQARWLAARGSDGITTSVRPAHTRYDGDVVFAVAGPGPAITAGEMDVLGFLATEAVADAVRKAVA